MTDSSLPYPGMRIGRPVPLDRDANASKRAAEIEATGAKETPDGGEVFAADPESVRARREALFWGFAKLFGS
jgi:hypothetical protein